MAAFAGASMRRRLLRLLDQHADVYRRGAGGRYPDDPTLSGLLCRKDSRLAQAGPGSPPRAAPTDDGTLYWHPDTLLLDGDQVVIDAFGGARWNVVAGSIDAEVGSGGTVLVRFCSLKRA